MPQTFTVSPKGGVRTIPAPMRHTFVADRRPQSGGHRWLGVTAAIKRFYIRTWGHYRPHRWAIVVGRPLIGRPVVFTQAATPSWRQRLHRDLRPHPGSVALHRQGLSMVSSIRGGRVQPAPRQELPFGAIKEGGAADSEPTASSAAATPEAKPCAPP